MNPQDRGLGINSGFVIKLGSAMIFLLITLILVLYGVNLKLRQPRAETFPADSPRQQLAFESGELRRSIEVKQSEDLRNYRWRDPQHRLAVVPIERAVQIYLESEKE